MLLETSLPLAIITEVNSLLNGVALSVLNLHTACIFQVIPEDTRRYSVRV